MDQGRTDKAAGRGGGPSGSQLLEMYRLMMLCRTLDERVWLLNRQGKAAIVASAQGHEAGQIGSAAALRVGHDRFYIYYRDLAVLLSVGVTPAQIMSGFLAKAGEPLSGARQFPTHGAPPWPEYRQPVERGSHPDTPSCRGRLGLEDARRGRGYHRLFR